MIYPALRRSGDEVAPSELGKVGEEVMIEIWASWGVCCFSRLPDFLFTSFGRETIHSSNSGNVNQIWGSIYSRVQAHLLKMISNAWELVLHYHLPLQSSNPGGAYAHATSKPVELCFFTWVCHASLTGFHKI